MKDYYSTLGIQLGTNYDEGAKQHRKLAFKYHPDVNPGDSTAAGKFKTVQEAWDALKDILPKTKNKSREELPDPSDKDFVKKYNALIAKWLEEADALAQSQANNTEATQRDYVPPKDPLQQDFDEVTWSTVGKKTLGLPGPTLALPGPPAKPAKPLSLRHISPQQAAYLIESWPTAIAALKILQQVKPEYALYDAILTRAQAHNAPTSDSKALSIVVDNTVDKTACDAAMSNVMKSLRAVRANASKLAQYIRMGDRPVDTDSLLMKLDWMETHIKTIAQELDVVPATPSIGGRLGKWLGGKG